MISLINELAAHLQMGQGDLEKFIRSAPARYFVFQIPKRSGGMRTIAQPSATLKEIQRFVLENKLSKFPIHPAATAYVRGSSIRKNAELHKNSKFILKLDFQDFFPSIRVNDWHALIRKNKLHSDFASDIYYYDRILFWGAGSFDPNRLSIGAPSSPCLSNAVMHDFDTAASELANRLGANYTRYADDITASADTKQKLLNFERQVANYLTKMKSPSLRFNENKRGIYGSGERRMVTGLVITPNKSVSIGRERKRKISAMLHKSSLSQLDSVDLLKLKGWLGYAIATEPDFVSRMRAKYGNKVLDVVLSFQAQEY